MPQYVVKYPKGCSCKSAAQKACERFNQRASCVMMNDSVFQIIKDGVVVFDRTVTGRLPTDPDLFNIINDVPVTSDGARERS